MLNKIHGKTTLIKQNIMEDNYLCALKVVPGLENLPVGIVVLVGGEVALRGGGGQIGSVFLQHVGGSLRSELNVVLGMEKKRQHDVENI